MPRETPIDAMTAHYLDRLTRFPAQPPFEVEIIDVVPTGLTVAGTTAADRQAMKAWRDALAETFGYRHPDHDDYVFHLTLAYMIDFDTYFAPELARLEALQADGLVELDGDWIQVTPRGRLLVRAVCMVFDKYLRAAQQRASYSRVM